MGGDRRQWTGAVFLAACFVVILGKSLNLIGPLSVAACHGRKCISALFMCLLVLGLHALGYGEQVQRS